MNILKIYFSAMLLASLSITGNAQHNHSGSGSNSNMNMNMNQNSHMNMVPAKTETLKVWGKCEMCKVRIEKIAMDNGAKAADWNVKTKLLTVNFDPSRSSLDYLSDKIARAGHDTGLRSAKDKAYISLPDCCKYERIR